MKLGDIRGLRPASRATVGKLSLRRTHVLASKGSGRPIIPDMPDEVCAGGIFPSSSLRERLPGIPSRMHRSRAWCN